ncbi:leucyl/phenylalanyl-tRNA--protein transferase [Plastorhodobacter daqingensis]|uniref:Leucyl/phenylalanyl-tRNA--protein transferase n=1 Tax=Plastorhodobacter daqingensis TaxID=1387281 RepID=A0ABW2UH72_9RHOB
MLITPDMLLGAYASGIFPMAESRTSDEVFWMDPHHRGIFPLDGFHISRSLRRRMLRGAHEIRINGDFGAVIDACAERPETWINRPIRDMYLALHRTGHAHSLEVWEDGMLAGGVYGVTLGTAFFGESMFSRQRDASKIALAYLVDRLRTAGFTLFDTQFLTPHLASLGAIEIPRAAYRRRLARALQREADFVTGEIPAAQDVIQRNSQRS